MKAFVAFGGVFVAVSMAVAPSQAQEGKSLAKCQKAMARETTKYAASVQKAVGKCLDKIAALTLAKGQPVADAAKTCASALRKLENSEKSDKTLSAKFRAKAAKACDPTAQRSRASHLPTDALDPNDFEGLQAGLLGGYCANFAGDGAFESVVEWIACADEAALCTALQQLAVEYPRAPEWLEGVAVEINAVLGPEPKFADAVSAASEIVARIDDDGDGEVNIVCGPAATSAPSGAVVLATGQTTSFGAGSDGGVGAGVARSFTDNGDGTITDEVTGLMWEKKSNDGSIHDYDRTYTWSTNLNNMDGTMVTSFLANLNAGSGFAGYTDWRIPNVMELQSIVDFGNEGPAVDGVFHNGCTSGCSVTTCSCTKTLDYWTSSSYMRENFGDFPNAFRVNFGNGGAGVTGKSTASWVRAVRGGLD